MQLNMQADNQVSVWYILDLDHEGTVSAGI